MAEEQKSYSEELEPVATADDDCFPDFLWNPVFCVDDTDTYYKIATSGYGLSTEVRRLRRKYADFTDWEDAMKVYDEYMKILAEKYGGIEVVLESYNIGMIDDYVPAKPQLKLTKRNKTILKTGIKPPRIVKPMEKGQFAAIAEGYFPYDPDRADQFSATEIDDKIPKWAEKTIRRASKKIEEKTRVENAYRGVASSTGVDMITQILEKMHNGDFDKLHEKESSTKNRTAIDNFNDLVDERYMDPDVESITLEEQYGTYLRRGRIVRADDERNVEIIKDLYSLGIDLLGGAKKNDTHIRLARRAMGLEENTEYMTKKELKKYKKKLKKEREWQEKASSSNRKNNALTRSLLGGRKPDFVTETETGVSISFRDLFMD